VAAATIAASPAIAGAYALPDGSHLLLRVEGGKVSAEAVGQQAYQLLATGDTVSVPEAATLNKKSGAIVAALMKGDVSLLAKSMGPGGPDSADIAQQEGQLREGRAGRFGTYKSFEVLGTILGPEGGMQTTVRLNYENGRATNLYTWDRGGHIMDVGGRPYQPVELQSGAGGELRSFNAATGKGAKFVAGDGTLSVQTPRGMLVLRKR